MDIMEILEINKIEVQVVDTLAGGALFELNKSITEINLEFHRVGAASTLTVKFVNEFGASIPFNDGSAISVMANGEIIFKGIIFTTTRNQWGECAIMAYDALRYLKNQVFVFLAENSSMDAIVKDAIKDAGCKVGNIIPFDYKYKPVSIHYDKTAFDLIQFCMNRAIIYGKIKKTFCMYHNYLTDCIDIQYCDTMQLPVVIGQKSFLTGYQIRSTIDEETYTDVSIMIDSTLSSEDGKNGVKKPLRAVNAPRMATWGTLRLIHDVPEAGFKQIMEQKNASNVSVAETELQELAQNMLAFYDRPTYVLTFDALGVIGVRAGNMIRVDIPSAGIGLNDGGKWDNNGVVESVRHKFKESSHTMSIEMKLGVIG